MDRTRLVLLVGLAAALAAAGCLGGDGASPSDGGSGGGGDGGGGGQDDGGSGDPLGFFNGSQTPDPNATEPGTTPYANASDGYRVLVPDDWTRVPGAPIWYVGPDSGVDEPRRNVNVVVGPANGMGQDAYVEASIERVRRTNAVDDVRVDAAVLAGDEASRIRYHATVRGTELTLLQLVAVHDDTAYAVTYTFPQGEDPGSEDELETFLESFAVLDGPAGADGSAEAAPSAGA